MKSYKDYMLFDKLPQNWCAGCSHGIVLQSIAAVMAELEVDKHDMALVSGIGCFGRVDDYLDINCMHVTHGRALAAATGVALGNPILPAEEKLKLLTAAGGIEVSDLYERFMHLVLEHKRESLLLFMAHIYIHLYRKDKRITRVQFSTAVPVSEEVKVHLQNKLKEETGSTIEFSGIVQPELIGGFRLRIGNYRIDASYATQLRDIRSRLLENR